MTTTITLTEMHKTMDTIYIMVVKQLQTKQKQQKATKKRKHKSYKSIYTLK